MDGGRVQEREKDPESQSRWHEDKVLTLSSYQKMPPAEPGGDPEPVRLVTTYVGTMQDSYKFGQLARVEAERMAIRRWKCGPSVTSVWYSPSSPQRSSPVCSRTLRRSAMAMGQL